MGITVDDLEPRTVSLEDAARILGMGRTKAYEHAQKGTFPARIFKIGNRWRVSIRSLDRLIDGDDEHNQDGPTQPI